MAHRNIPLFIPHEGCAFRCAFCDQASITGEGRMTLEKAKTQIEEVLTTLSPDDDVEIAFFGGSFTGIGDEKMQAYLDLAQTYVEAKKVQGIRFSTRPDYIDEHILEILSHYTIAAVELGIQSLKNHVLDAVHRGHDEETAKRAAMFLRKAGYPWVAQLMIGLPESTIDDELYTAKTAIEWGTSASRIYPTVVFRNTLLARWTEEGRYTPLSVEEAAERSAKVLRLFEDHDIPVLRIGLCASENLTDPTCAMAGPTHPSLGELTRSRVARMRVEEILSTMDLPEDVEKLTVQIPKNSLSVFVGQKRANVTYFKDKYHIHHIFFVESTQNEIRVKPNGPLG